MNKKIIVPTMALAGAVVLAGCGGTATEEAPAEQMPTEQTAPPAETMPICDENGNVYASEQEAKDAGLTEAQYGATYCQYLDDDGDMDDVYDSAMGNAIYTIEGEEIILVDGEFSKPAAPGSASMISAELEDDLVAMGDLNSDGTEDDYAGIIFYSGGGSGNFAYVVALVDGKGTNGVMLGDRVPVDSVTIDDKGVITVKTYERAEGEAMADKPSVAVTKTFVVTDGVLTEQK